MNFPRLDIAYFLCRLSKYTHNPNRDYWVATVRLMKYSRSNVIYSILYSEFVIVLEEYGNACWTWIRMR